MGKFNGVKIGDRVELKLTEFDVIDRGKDKNGVYLQTVDNRFYEDQDTLQEVKIKERGIEFGSFPTTNGSIVRNTTSGQGRGGGYWILLDGSWIAMSGRAEACNNQIGKRSNYSLVFDAGKVSK